MIVLDPSTGKIAHTARVDVSPRRDIALAFLELVAAGRGREAFEKYAAPDFRHHNPHYRAGADTLIRATDESARQNPEMTLAVKHLLEDGEFVAVHSHARQNPVDPGVAVVHILRFVGGRVAEFWDVVQQIPADSPNQDGMF